MIASIGRGAGIRTRDPLHPMQVRYQAAPRPDKFSIIAETWSEVALLVGTENLL